MAGWLFWFLRVAMEVIEAGSFKSIMSDAVI